MSLSCCLVGAPPAHYIADTEMHCSEEEERDRKLRKESEISNNE